MKIIEIILIGLSLSMDAFSISIILALKNGRKKIGIIISLSFGLFQFIMPILGFYLGNILNSNIISYNSYLGSFILIVIGILMLTEKGTKENTKLNLKELFILSLATSIDAFIVGISFSFSNTHIITSSIIIGFITFIICLIGYYLGYIFNKKAHQYASIIGGITLIILGIKNLLETLL